MEGIIMRTQPGAFVELQQQLCEEVDSCGLVNGCSLRNADKAAVLCALSVALRYIWKLAQVPGCGETSKQCTKNTASLWK